MVRWLIFNAVTARKKPVFGRDWDDYYAVLEKAKKENWKYKDKLNAYAKLADKHFATKEFNNFCADSLADFDEKAIEFFASDAFDDIIENSVRRYFKLAHEVPPKLMHYKGILRFWVKCEAERLGLSQRETVGV